MRIINHTTGEAAGAVLCCSHTAENSSNSKWQHVSMSALCVEESTGYMVRPSVTLWRSGRKLPTRNIPRGVIFLKEARRKPCCGSACPTSALSLGWDSQSGTRGVDLNSTSLVSFPADSLPRTTKLLSAPVNKGPCWGPACSVTSSSFLEVQLKNVHLLQTSLVIYMALWVLIRLELPVRWKMFLPWMSCSTKEKIQEQIK